MGATNPGINIFANTPPLGEEFNTTGRVYYVGSTAVPGGVVGVDAEGAYGDRPQQPFATLNYAAAAARNTANAGGLIVVLPGHLETITAANGVDIAVAGLKIIGLGWGLSRPQFNMTTAVGASFRINANSTYLRNVRFTGGIDNLTNAIVVNGVTDCVLRDIEYRDVTGQAAIGFLASNNSDRLLMERITYFGAAAAGSTACLQFDGCDDLELRHFRLEGNASTSLINFATTLSARIWIHDGRMWQQNAADVCINDAITGTTGGIGPRLFMMLTDNAANITEAVTGATFHLFDDQVQVVNLVNEKSLAINWVASTDA